MLSVPCTEHKSLLNEDTGESHISDTYLYKLIYPSPLTRSCGTRGVDYEKRRQPVQIKENRITAGLLMSHFSPCTIGEQLERGVADMSQIGFTWPMVHEGERETSYC